MFPNYKIALLLFLFYFNSQAIAISTDDEACVGYLPISFNIPLYFVNDSNYSVRLGTGLASSLRVSKSFRVGFCFRIWGIPDSN